jgi:acetylornithine deacetylase/succinyl-diaminopimelate desuccinylase-like protein
MPRSENANVLAAEAVTKLSAAWPARLTDVTKAMLDRTIAALDGSDDLPPEALRLLRAAASGDARASAAALAGVCLPVYTRVLDAMLRDTLSPNILHGGVKFNIVPGMASLEVDVRRLPGTTEEDMEARIRERLGPELSGVTDIEALISSEPLVHPYEDPDGLFPILEAAIRDHDPAGIPVPAMAPFGTDAKHLLDLGVPTYGFSPLRQPPGETYIERWHGIDERVSVEGLRWGLPVLYDAVRRFCA